MLGGNLAPAKTAAIGALTLFSEIGAPYDAAVARTVLAEVREQDGQHDAALMEWQAARNAFADFGAERDTLRCDSMLAQLPARTTPSVSSDGAAVFRQERGVRIVQLAGAVTSLPDMKGFRYLERLLAEPGREFHVLDLVAVEEGVLPIGREAHQEGLVVLDDQARLAYRRRLAEVQEDIDDATVMNDPGRRDLAERDRDYLIAELRSAVGLAGRPRTTGASAERARTAVTRSIRYALQRLSDHHPLAATHLGQRLRTGTYCSYVPDLMTATTWDTV